LGDARLIDRSPSTSPHNCKADHDTSDGGERRLLWLCSRIPSSLRLLFARFLIVAAAARQSRPSTPNSRSPSSSAERTLNDAQVLPRRREFQLSQPRCDPLGDVITICRPPSLHVAAIAATTTDSCPWDDDPVYCCYVSQITRPVPNLSKTAPAEVIQRPSWRRGDTAGGFNACDGNRLRLADSRCSSATGRRAMPKRQEAWEVTPWSPTCGQRGTRGLSVFAPCRNTHPSSQGRLQPLPRWADSKEGTAPAQSSRERGWGGQVTGMRTLSTR
jgi:hypothetical protein